jgi:hypothetical protein
LGADFISSKDEKRKRAGPPRQGWSDPFLTDMRIATGARWQAREGQRDHDRLM